MRDSWNSIELSLGGNLPTLRVQDCAPQSQLPLTWEFEKEQIRLAAKQRVRRMHQTPPLHPSNNSKPSGQPASSTPVKRNLVSIEVSTPDSCNITPEALSPITRSPSSLLNHSTSESELQLSDLPASPLFEQGQAEDSGRWRKRHLGSSAQCRRKLEQLEKQAPRSKQSVVRDALTAYMRTKSSIQSPAKPAPKAAAAAVVQSKSYKQRITEEIAKSREFTFNRYRAMLKQRDDARARGDKEGFERACKALSEIDIHSMDFHDPAFTGSDHRFIPEAETRLLVKDLHLYSLYCYANRISLILRDVAPGAASAYQGTFHLPDEYNDDDGIPIYDKVTQIPRDVLNKMTEHRIKAVGKGITVGLKSSPYEPIVGNIPLDPRLSKLMRVFAQNVKELEERLLGFEEGDDDITLNLLQLAKAESEKAVIIQKYEHENEKAMAESQRLYEELLGKYQAEMQYSFDKEKVSQTWIDRFHDARFLGETHFTNVNNQPVYYFVKGNDVLRDNSHNPVFVAQTDTGWQLFNSALKAFEPVGPEVVEEYEESGCVISPVKVVVYRRFALHKITKRIVEDTENVAMIVPDYDGLAYCYDRTYPAGVVDPKASDERNVQALVDYFEKQEKDRMNTSLVEGMGNVAPIDVQHVHEVRALTDWKQNHGEEFNNIAKTQELSRGNYVAIDSEGELQILHSAEEIFKYYRHLWMTGRPMPLNPKWQVTIDSEGLPVWTPKMQIYDNKIELAMLIEQCEKLGRWTGKSLESAYKEIFPEEGIVKKFMLPHHRDDGILREYVKLKDEEKVLKVWVKLKQQEMLPLLVLSEKDAEKLPPEERAVIERLFPQVRERKQQIVQARIHELNSELQQQRHLFFLKHNVDCRV
eukprot:TRINITY_DN6195_c0_g1_i1.p1 TRINITY_DN6195_c0_g1~~TRINITY_DN6195_c0_g1_i1.p1  ORF type:complete len:869 (+),score=170.71 TRINITY_DN6195_c0_g1_i1:43-2649(+)